MNRLIILFIACALFVGKVNAQGEYHQGEFGVTIGAAHYFGDLNTRAALNRPKPSLGVFYRKLYGNYVGMRVGARFAQLGYSDVFSKNEYQHMRNLSFNSNIFELALQGDFNFLKYIPGDEVYGFTPYVTLGVGLFNYDPYTYYNGTKYFLRPLGTEGQAGGYLGRTSYSTMAVCIPFGVGLKYSINNKISLAFEITQRFTTTDYLDDVSTTYAPNGRNGGSINYFPSSSNQFSIADLLQDRSYEIDPLNPLSSVPGRQRGWSKQKDQYVIGEIGISINIDSYRCPTN